MKSSAVGSRSRLGAASEQSFHWNIVGTSSHKHREISLYFFLLSRFIGSKQLLPRSRRPTWLQWRKMARSATLTNDPGIWNFIALRCEQERRKQYPRSGRGSTEMVAHFRNEIGSARQQGSRGCKRKKIAINREKCCQRCKIPARQESMYLNFMLTKRSKNLGRRVSNLCKIRHAVGMPRR